MEQLKQLPLLEMTFVAHAKAQKQSQVQVLLIVEVVEVQDTKQSDKDHSLFNRFVAIVMALDK